MKSIEYITKDIDYQINEEEKITKWLQFVAKSEKCKIKEVKYYFVSENEILIINNKYLKHFYVTDIVTFGTNFLDLINGDVFICIDVIKENAVIYSKGNFMKELLRVIVHGLLHLIGYNDTTEVEKGIMRNKEDFYLEYFENIFFQL